ncbi:prepilin peptidase [Hungatella hathewayi]
MILLLVLAAGAYYDVREHRIPNWWVAVSAVCGILLSMVESGAPPGPAAYLKECGLFLARMLTVSALFFPLFICRMIGAGDIKLAALICGYSGLAGGASAIGLGFLIGAFWSFLKMMVKGSFHERFCHLAAYIRRIYHTKTITAYYDKARDGTEAVIPLGVCLFFGTMAFIMMPG